MTLTDLTDFLKSIVGGKVPLDELPVGPELSPRFRQAHAAWLESTAKLKAAELQDLSGYADTAVAKDAAALELLRRIVKRDADNRATLEAALTVARQREADASAREEARMLCDGRLGDECDKVATLSQQAYAGKLALARTLDRACSPAVRELLESDPTAGIRPALQALLGDRLPPVARELFASGSPLPLKPGPRKGDRRLAYSVGKLRRRETFDGENWVPDRQQTVTRGDE